jgi:hypothetical protein
MKKTRIAAAVALLAGIGIGIFAIGASSSGGPGTSSAQSAVAPSTTLSSSAASSSSIPAYPGGNSTSSSCILSVPENATVTQTFNSTNVGSVVIFQNGTSRYFDAASCPQPLQAQLYAIVYPIVTDPSFTAIENGTTYHYVGMASGSRTFANGTTVNEPQYHFVSYGSPLDPNVTNCSGGVVPISSYGTYSTVDELVAFLPYYANGTANYSAMTLLLQLQPSQFVQECTTTTTANTSEVYTTLTTTQLGCGNGLVDDEVPCLNLEGWGVNYTSSSLFLVLQNQSPVNFTLDITYSGSSANTGFTGSVTYTLNLPRSPYEQTVASPALRNLQLGDQVTITITGTAGVNFTTTLTETAGY